MQRSSQDRRSLSTAANTKFPSGSGLKERTYSDRRDKMSGRLEGKVCVITGTGGSMGRAAALLFTRQGAMVVGCDLSEANGLSALQEFNTAYSTMVSFTPSNLSQPTH